MTDWSGKWKPALERIACMVGKGKGLPYLGSGAIPNFTDHDICHAVAAARRVRNGKPLQTCVRPEILELAYAGDFTKVPNVARAAAEVLTRRKVGELPASTHEIIRARHAGMIAARGVAGRLYGQDEIKREAWSIVCNYEKLEKDVGLARVWVEGELFDAGLKFLGALKSRLDYTVHEISAYQEGLEVESRQQRAEILRKVFPRAADDEIAQAMGRPEFAPGNRTFGILTLGFRKVDEELTAGVD